MGTILGKIVSLIGSTFACEHENVRIVANDLNDPNPYILCEDCGFRQNVSPEWNNILKPINKPIILEGWISVEDRLPDRYKEVFCLEGGSSFDIAHRISGDDENLWFIDNQGNVFKPTHWLPFTVNLP